MEKRAFIRTLSVCLTSIRNRKNVIIARESLLLLYLSSLSYYCYDDDGHHYYHYYHHYQYIMLLLLLLLLIKNFTLVITITIAVLFRVCVIPYTLSVHTLFLRRITTFFRWVSGSGGHNAPSGRMHHAAVRAYNA